MTKRGLFNTNISRVQHNHAHVLQIITTILMRVPFKLAENQENRLNLTWVLDGAFPISPTLFVHSDTRARPIDSMASRRIRGGYCRIF